VRVLTVGNLYPPHLGGYELSWSGAVEALRVRGHEVTVLTTDTPPPAPVADPPWVRRELGWYWREHAWPRFSWRARRALERRNARVLEAAIAGTRPEVVGWWAMGGMTLSLLRRAGLPAVGFVHDDWMAYGPEVDPSRRPVDLADAARWLFVSEATRATAIARRGPLPDTGILAPGVDPAFTAVPERAEWGWRLLCAGRIDPRKGLATAIRALARLPEGTTLRVIGAGDEAHAAVLRELAASLGVAGRVRFEPPRDRAGLASAYAEADAVLFPVEWAEPFGLVPLEAMAVGRPVVATGAGGSADFLRDGVNALRFAAGDADALAGALRRLADDPALRARLRAGGLATAAEHSQAAWHDGVERELRAKAAG
jgi:glycogen synthase